MKLRVGLIGLGPLWDLRYAPALRALGDRFEVRAVCDHVAHRAEQAARAFQATAVDGFRALLSRPDVDAVLVLAPHWYGALPILAACEAGKAVFCAAALHVDLNEARGIKDRVEASGIAFMAEFPRRQAPATLRLKELIATQLGAPRLLFGHQRLATTAEDDDHSDSTPPHGDRTNSWRNTRELLELVDWCRYVVGVEPSSVLGVSHQRGATAGDVDYEMMSLDFSEPALPGRGPLAQISCGRYTPASWPEAAAFRPPAALQVSCQRGIAFIDLPTTLIWFDRAGRHMESLDSERPVGEQMLSQFHRSVTSLVRNSASLDDAYRALAVVLASRRSQRDGRRVAMEFR